MLGRSLKDSATQLTVLESLNPRMVWVGKDLPGQPCSTGRDTFPRLLQRDAGDDLLLENLFVFLPTQNNPIISESVSSQAAQSREFCHRWHQHCHPTCDLASFLLTKGRGQAVSQPLLGDISSREWLMKDTPVPSTGSRTELCPGILQDVPSHTQYTQQVLTNSCHSTGDAPSY